MSYCARVVLDSISPGGIRLTTIELTVPRFVLAEVNTHRAFSRNSASSRAIPTTKFIDRAMKNPVVPLEWGANQKGMSATELLPSEIAAEATAEWLAARDDAVRHASNLLKLNVHKQIANRLLEPFMWHTMVITATDWANFFAQRLNGAQPELMKGARLTFDTLAESVPKPIRGGEWHLPFIQPDEKHLPLPDRQKISVARCARTSYLTHYGIRDLHEDYRLFDFLQTQGHWSPFEHQAYPLVRMGFSGNFFGWCQFRKLFASENVLRLPVMDAV